MSRQKSPNARRRRASIVEPRETHFLTADASAAGFGEGRRGVTRCPSRCDAGSAEGALHSSGDGGGAFGTKVRVPRVQGGGSLAGNESLSTSSI